MGATVVHMMVVRMMVQSATPRTTPASVAVVVVVVACIATPTAPPPLPHHPCPPLVAVYVCRHRTHAAVYTPVVQVGYIHTQVGALRTRHVHPAPQALWGSGWPCRLGGSCPRHSARPYGSSRRHRRHVYQRLWQLPPRRRRRRLRHGLPHCLHQRMLAVQATRLRLPLWGLVAAGLG